MKRREFITLLGGAATWPHAAGAQQGARLWRIGVLETTSLALNAANFAAFLQGLRELGYVEGHNISIEYRSSDTAGLFRDLATDLVHLNVDLILVRGTPAVLAAKSVTTTTPIIIVSSADPLVAVGSLAHPGGNVTGLSKLTPELTAKRLELLKELLPNASRVAVIWDPGYSAFLSDWQELRARARALNVSLQSVEVRSVADLDRAFAAIARERTDAVITFSDTMTYNSPTRVAGLATEARLPLISPFRELAEAGCLMSYGPNVPDMYRQAARYVDKILKGAKPADLPVEQPTKFELLVNLKTAKALGVSIPQSILLRADELIE